MSNLLLDKKLAFIYNVRHKYPDSNNPLTFAETDFDDQETIDAILKHLINLGYDVLPIEANTEALANLLKEKENIGFVFNYSEEVFGSTPKIYMAEILEELGLPFTGCSNQTQRLIIDKGEMKQTLLDNNVSTLPFQISKNPEDKLNTKLNYPVIVKPIARGSSAGITNKSVVTNDQELAEQIKFIVETFDEPAIIEPYIDGREFSVGMLSNPPEFLPVIEPKHAKIPQGLYHIDSLEVKWQLEEELGEDYFNCPAETGPELQSKIEELCLSAWKALGIRDFCRIDLRMDPGGKVYILDVNSPPGLIPPEISTTSYFPMAANVKGYNYEDLLSKVINSGLLRNQ